MTWPAEGIETLKVPATSGRSPIMTNSPVPMPKPPMARANSAQWRTCALRAPSLRIDLMEGRLPSSGCGCVSAILRGYFNCNDSFEIKNQRDEIATQAADGSLAWLGNILQQIPEEAHVDHPTRQAQDSYPRRADDSGAGRWSRRSGGSRAMRCAA